MLLYKFSIFSLSLVSTLTLNSICYAMESEGEDLGSPYRGKANQEMRKLQLSTADWYRKNCARYAQAFSKLPYNQQKAIKFFKLAHDNEYAPATLELAKLAYIDNKFEEAQELFDLACTNFEKHHAKLDDQMTTLVAKNMWGFAQQNEGLKNTYAKYQGEDIFKAFSGEKKPTPTHENSEELRKLYDAFGDNERDGQFTPSSSDDSKFPVMKRPSQNSTNSNSSNSSNSSSGNDIHPARTNEQEEFEKLVVTRLTELKLGNEEDRKDDFDYDAFDASDEEN
jgi:hypothetical protein